MTKIRGKLRAKLEARVNSNDALTIQIEELKCMNKNLQDNLSAALATRTSVNVGQRG